MLHFLCKFQVTGPWWLPTFSIILCCCSWTSTLTHWGRDKMAAIFQTTFSNGFSWMKMYEFRLTFRWSLVQVMAWRRPGDKPLSEPMMVRLLTHLYASLGLNGIRVNDMVISSCQSCYWSLSCKLLKCHLLSNNYVREADNQATWNVMRHMYSPQKHDASHYSSHGPDTTWITYYNFRKFNKTQLWETTLQIFVTHVAVSYCNSYYLVKKFHDYWYNCM